jgi:hypothetical protein
MDFKDRFTRDPEPVFFEIYQDCSECGFRLPVDELVLGMCIACLIKNIDLNPTQGELK